jgi:hypothetical protein
MRARAASLGLAALMLLAGATAAVAPAAAAVPDPVVTGPIPANVAPGNPARDYPWMATMHNLAAVGYTEEEFFYEGTANSYDTSGALGTTGSVVSSGHPYKTRMVVRRPLSPAQFNGTVIVEWQNVTAGYDLDANWGGSFEHFIRSGYAWVGVSAQRVGVQGAPNGLKAWSPLRYGQLDVTAGGTITNDALSYDIFAQAMQAIRHPVGVNVMGGLNVQRVLAIGASQSASRLAIYINSLHPLIGDPVDAYMLYIGGGRIRGDLTVPVFKLISETDVPGQVASRQPDSAVFRSWEVAGSSHSGRRTALNSRPLALRDGVAPAEGVCDFPVHPRVPSHYVANAVYDHLVHWVRDKTPPPSAAPVTTVGNTIQRDSFGNALGGVRLAEFAVPTAENTGDNAGSAFCRLYGRYVPFDTATLNGLYPSHASYTGPVAALTQANVQAGYILADDAARTDFLAAQSIVGTQAPCGPVCRAAQDLLEQSQYYLYTSQGGDEFANKVIGIVAGIAKADGASGTSAATANAATRRALQRYIDGVKVLQSRGIASAVSAAELIAAANQILASVP